MFSVIDITKVKPLIIPSPSVSSAALHLHFYTHLICPNKAFPILHSEMSRILSELETMLAIEFVEKGLLSGYPIIIAKVFKSMSELDNANVKFKVLNN